MARIDAVSVVIDFRPLWRCPATALMMTYNRQKDPSNCNKMHQIMLETGPPDWGPEFAGAIWAEGVRKWISKNLPTALAVSCNPHNRWRCGKAINSFPPNIC